MNPSRPAVIAFGLLVAVAGTSPGHADIETNVPASPLESPPLAQPAPESPAALPARAPDATVRTASAAYIHTPALNHPRRVVTTYRAETLAPAMNANTASSWETTEYNAQEGLGLIRASTGYAARTGGRPGGGGVTIAVFEGAAVAYEDTSYPGHPDLRDVLRVDLLRASGPGQHPTQVGGIAAARRNGWEMHGVAYNANIVTAPTDAYQGRDFEATFASVAGLSGRYGPYSVNMYTADPAASAHIVNLSIAEGGGSPATVASKVRGLKLLAQEGRIIVVAAGNRGQAEPDHLFALSVADEGIAGHAITVGMLDSTGNAPEETSNKCGAVRRWCLFAPGDDIYSTSTYPDGYWNTARGFRRTSGTSFAAPHVAGAAAAVWAAFPDKTGAEIVQRLLDTARQVDTANGNYDATTGLSAIYGHGALDLGAAMDPNTAW